MFELLKQKKVQVFLIVFLTILAYSNIFKNQFVWDDQFLIQDWKAIRDISFFPQALGGALPPQFSGAFRPGLSISYFVFYQLFGQNSFWWHMQSLLVHIASTVLVYFIIQELVMSNLKIVMKKSQLLITNYQLLLPFLVSLLFGLHPIHTEAVTYVAASINTIGALFFFASFYFYLSSCHPERSEGSSKKKILRLRLRMTLSIIFAFLAFFTYEFTLTLPLVIILYTFFYRRRIKRFYREYLFVAPYFIFVSLYLLLRIFFIHSVGRGGYLLGSFYLTFLVMTKAFVKYLYLLLFPIHQSINHVVPNNILSGYYIDLKKQAILSQSIWEPGVLLGILGILAMLGAVIFFLKRKPIISFSLGWFLITLLPASNIVPVQEIMAERYLYLPSFGFILLEVILIVQFFTYFLQRIKNSKLKIQNYNSKFKNFNLLLSFLPFAFCLLTLFYGYLTYQRNKVWVSQLTLWEDTVKKSPISEIAYFNLGNAYGRVGEYEKAINAYKNAISNKPRSMGSYINMGNIYMYEGKYLLAQKAYEGALRIDPGSPSNYNNIGGAFEKEGNIKKATEYYLYALRLDSAHKNSKENLERILKTYPDLSLKASLKTTQLYSDDNISFSYPKDWKLKKNNKTIMLNNETDTFLIELTVNMVDESPQGYVKRQEGLQEGQLINQGLAQISSFKISYARIWKEESVESMQLFLFKDKKVLKMYVSPSNSAFMREFDRIVESILLN